MRARVLPLADRGDAVPGEVARTLRPGESFVVSADLGKGREALETCCNDPAGHSAFADFRLNHLTRLNRLHGADFVLDDLVPEACYDADTTTVEGRLRARADRAVPVPGLELTVRVPRGRSVNVG